MFEKVKSPSTLLLLKLWESNSCFQSSKLNRSHSLEFSFKTLLIVWLVHVTGKTQTPHNPSLCSTSQLLCDSSLFDGKPSKRVKKRACSPESRATYTPICSKCTFRSFINSFHKSVATKYHKGLH